MYLVFVAAVYFTIRDVQLIMGCIKTRKKKNKLPVLQQPKDPEE